MGVETRLCGSKSDNADAGEQFSEGSADEEVELEAPSELEPEWRFCQLSPLIDSRNTAVSRWSGQSRVKVDATPAQARSACDTVHF